MQQKQNSMNTDVLERAQLQVTLHSFEQVQYNYTVIFVMLNWHMRRTNQLCNKSVHVDIIYMAQVTIIIFKVNKSII